MRGDLVSRGLEMSVGSLGLEVAEKGTGSHTWWGKEQLMWCSVRTCTWP